MPASSQRPPPQRAQPQQEIQLETEERRTCMHSFLPIFPSGSSGFLYSCLGTCPHCCLRHHQRVAFHRNILSVFFFVLFFCLFMECQIHDFFG